MLKLHFVLTLFCSYHGNMVKESWEIMEKSWNLIPQNCWEPWTNYHLERLSLSRLGSEIFRGFARNFGHP